MKLTKEQKKKADKFEDLIDPFTATVGNSHIMQRELIRRIKLESE